MQKSTKRSTTQIAISTQTCTLDDKNVNNYKPISLFNWFDLTKIDKKSMHKNVQFFSIKMSFSLQSSQLNNKIQNIK